MLRIGLYYLLRIKKFYKKGIIVVNKNAIFISTKYDYLCIIQTEKK